MAYIGREPQIGNFQVCDAISVVNGQAAYTMQVSITFASNLATGDVINFIHILGSVLDLGVPSDDTVGAAQIKDDLISGTTALASEPADTDEFLVSDAGVLKRIDYSLIKGGGKILQVVNSDNEYDTTISATSYGDVLSASGTTWETAITPSASTSKILVLASVSLQTAGTSGAAEGRGKIQMMAKTGSGSYSSVDEIIYAGAYDYGGNGIVFGWHHPVSLLHSPSTTSAVTFKFQIAKYSGADSLVTNNLGFSRIQLLEVGA